MNNNEYIEQALIEGDGDILKGFRKLKKRYNPETGEEANVEIFENIITSEAFYKDNDKKEVKKNAQKVVYEDKPQSIFEVIKIIFEENFSILVFWKKNKTEGRS
jgi:hypothetical protein